MKNFVESDSEDELPPGWEQRATVDGKVFYANHADKSTTWQHPRTGKRKRVAEKLPVGWQREVLDDGRVVFVDHENRTTTFTDPRLAFAVEEGASTAEFRQRFDASSRASNVLHGRGDLANTVTIVTGANSGIGLETARTIAENGGRVIFACRTLSKAESAIRVAIRRRGAVPNCFPMQIDLTSFRSVEEFAGEFLRRFDRLDVLVLNADSRRSMR